jgi:hypothetical protein
MNTPLFADAAVADIARVWTIRSISSSFRVATSHRLKTPRVLIHTPHTPIFDEAEVEAGNIRHDSSVLIFDELEYEPFTEGRRSPAANSK